MVCPTLLCFSFVKLYTVLDRVPRVATDRCVEHGGRAVNHAYVGVAKEVTTIWVKSLFADIQTNIM